MSARVKVKANLSLSYGFNQNSDEGLGTVHNLCPSLSCLKSILWIPGSHFNRIAQWNNGNALCEREALFKIVYMYSFIQPFINLLY